MIRSSDPQAAINIPLYFEAESLDAIEVQLHQSDEDEEAGVDGDELIELYGSEAVQLANHFLHRYRVSKLYPQGIMMTPHDLLMFMIVDEEIARKQAIDLKKMDK